MQYPLTFYIIYTPDTVRLLSFFVWSLLEYSDCHFCLVSNACDKDEQALLHNLCEQDTRLTFIALPTVALWQHGKALDFLRDLNQAAYFCFMDSDIFATNQFMLQFEPLIGQHAGVFSASSLWMRDEDKVLPTNHKAVDGRYNKTAGGICLGSSYFAIYNYPLINALESPPQVSFQKYTWDVIAPHNQTQLTHIGIQRDSYDTCKLFNLLLLSQKQTLHFEEAEHLIHIGSISWQKKSKKFLSRTHLAKIINQLPEGYWKQQLLRIALVGRGVSNLWVRKEAVSHYFSQLLVSLVDSKQLPHMPKLHDEEIQSSVVEASKAIIALHRQVS